MNEKNRFYFIMLTFISLILGYYAYQVIKPFIEPIIWAGVLCILFYPAYEIVLKYVKVKAISSLIMLAVTLTIILGPILSLTYLLITELKDLVKIIEGGNIYSLNKLLHMPATSWVVEKFKSISGYADADLEMFMQDHLTNIIRQIASKLTVGVKNAASVAVDFTLMILTMFYFFIDGPSLVKKLGSYLPFEAEQKDRLESQITGLVVSTVFGGVAVAIIQGIMGGAAFYFLKVPSPVLLGAVLSIMSFLPMLGAFAVWGLVVVYLIIQASYTKAVILLLFGTFGISLVDNILKPIIIGGRTKMPTLLILFSVLGGIKLFGLIGLIMGPMSVAIFISVLEIFRGMEGGQNA